MSSSAATTTASVDSEPERECKLCPRLAGFRTENKLANPNWFNGAVPSFGDTDASLLIVGLAPGLKGANRTGRPFTGDYAGDLLYATLLDFDFATGKYEASAKDSLKLKGCMISNAVRCVPPKNKPTSTEINTCRNFLAARITSMGSLDVIIALGRIAHDSTLMALRAKKSAHPFGHGHKHLVADSTGRSLTMLDSYHCSRYNTNTRRLTEEMFHSVFAQARSLL